MEVAYGPQAERAVELDDALEAGQGFEKGGVFALGGPGDAGCWEGGAKGVVEGDGADYIPQVREAYEEDALGGLDGFGMEHEGP